MDEHIYCRHDNRIDNHHHCKACDSERKQDKSAIVSCSGIGHKIPALIMQRTRHRISRILDGIGNCDASRKPIKKPHDAKSPEPVRENVYRKYPQLKRKTDKE